MLAAGYRELMDVVEARAMAMMIEIPKDAIAKLSTSEEYRLHCDDVKITQEGWDILKETFDAKLVEDLEPRFKRLLKAPPETPNYVSPKRNG